MLCSTTCTTAISIATVPSSRLSVSASNLEQFAKKTFNPITLAERDGIFSYIFFIYFLYRGRIFTKSFPYKGNFLLFSFLYKGNFVYFLPYNDFLTFYYIDTRRQTNRLTNIRFCKESLHTATIQGMNT